MNGALQLSEAVAFFGQKFGRTCEWFDKTELILNYLMLEMSLFGAAIIRTIIIKGEISSAVAGL